MDGIQSNFMRLGEHKKKVVSEMTEARSIDKQLVHRNSSQELDVTAANHRLRRFELKVHLSLHTQTSINYPHMLRATLLCTKEL
jgi:hypothetical protein